MSGYLYDTFAPVAMVMLFVAGVALWGFFLVLMVAGLLARADLVNAVEDDGADW